MWLFSDFMYGFRCRSTADLLTVVSDRNTRTFDRSGAAGAVALDTSKAFDRVWDAGLLHNIMSYGVSSRVFTLISSFVSNRRFWLLWIKNMQLLWQSMLMILLSTLSVSSLLICDNK